MVQRSLPFLVLAGLMSCKGDPTGDLRNGPDHLQAVPSSIFVRADSTKFVTVTAVDEQGNTVAVKFSDPQGVGPGITVTRDLTFQPVVDKNGNLVPGKETVSARYLVTPTSTTANSSFTVTAGGKTIDIPVRITPVTTAGLATASSATPGNGDTTSLTLTAPYKFSSTSVATIGGTTLYKVGVSADSSVLRVVAGPGLTGNVSITNIVLGYAPAAASFTTTSVGTVTTPALPNVTLNKTNAVAGDTIVVTAPAKFKFTTTSAPTVGAAGLASLGISTDSTQLRFLIGPSANAKVVVNNMRVAGALTLGPFSDSSAAALTTPAIANFPATYASATPAIQDTVTITAGAGFKFLPTATIKFGTVPAVIISRGADSSSIKFVPTPGSTSGPGTVTGVVLSFLRSVSLTLPTTTSLTVPAGYTATSFATAPTLAMPAAGKTITYVDGGPEGSDPICLNNPALGGKCRVFKFTLAAPATLTFKATWEGTADLGIYFFDNTQTIIAFGGCDALGRAATGQPEQCTRTFAAGTYYFVADDFGPFYAQNDPPPLWTRYDITQ